MTSPSFRALTVLLFIIGCGSPPPEPTDAGTDAQAIDAAVSCTSADECNDGLFCNGMETCTDGVCAVGAPVVCDDAVGCTIDSCSEAMRRCISNVPDDDHDGSGDIECVDAAGVPLGDDCRDDDPNRFPGNVELCDVELHDEDCDETTHGGIDSDGDGFEDARCCNGTSCGPDCDDARPGSRPDATEVCNLVDDDCNGEIDEGVGIAGFVDADYDGFGGTTVRTACGGAVGFSVYDTDCDDHDPARNPGQAEVCDLRDNDCDPNVDEMAAAVDWFVDSDGDGFGSRASGITHTCVPPTGHSLLASDCDDTTNTRSPAQPEICNGIDDDCSGVADYAIEPGDLEDDDRDGIADLLCGEPRGRDCDDHDPASAPGQAETCNGRDDDCDSRVDEDAATLAFYRDTDGDGFGSVTSGTIVGCVPMAGYVARGGDCDDGSSLRYPGSAEGCNATDDDCDGAIDEGEASASCAIPHTRAVCIVGRCREVACDDGYADCGIGTVGCETNVANDRTSCGSCGHVCVDGEGCIDGSCGPSESALVTSGGASADGETIHDLATIGANDTVVVGSTPSNITFGSPSTVGLGAGDGFLSRVSSSVTYTVPIGGPSGFDEAVSVAVDVPNDRIYVVGYVQSATTNLGIPGDASGSPRGFLAAYRLTDGTLVNASRWGGDSPSIGVRLSDVAVVGGAVFVTGFTFGDFTPPSGTHTTGFDTDGFVARVDPATLRDTWLVRGGGAGFEGLESIAVDDAGTVYVAGAASTASMSLGSIVATGDALGGSAVLVGAVSGTGTPIWARMVTGSNLLTPYDLAVGGGAVVLAGSANETVHVGAITLTATGLEQNDALLASFAPSTGAVRWAHLWGAGQEDALTAVSIDAVGNIVASGSFSGTTDFGAGPISASGSTDVLVLGVRNDGTTRFSWRQGDESDEIGTGVGVAMDAIVYAGRFSSYTIVAGSFLGSYGGIYLGRVGL